MMETMKNPVVLLTCVALLSSMAVLASQSSFEPEKCCFVFIPNPMAVNRVVSVKKTERGCPKAGVLFTMKSGRVICADPSLDWVKKIMEAKKNQNT